MSAEEILTATCPKCGSVFRLTPQHLQAAKGWVQCGMCGHVFHSGIKPAPEPANEKPAAPIPSHSAETPAESVSAEAAASEIEIPQAGQEPAAPPPAETAETEAPVAGLSGLSHRIAEQDVPSEFGPKLESIILVDPSVPMDDMGPLPVIGPAPEPPKSEPSPVSAPPAATAVNPESATSSGWIPRRPAAPPPSRSIKTRKRGWLFTLLVILLLLALAAQFIFFLRDKLAADYPEFRPYLARMCGQLDCSLSLPRDTKQVVILGSDLQTGNDGDLALEITLANRAPHAMAWPVLELTLTDVEDQPVARRMFAPSEYLPSREMETAGIQGVSEVPFNLQLQSKGLKAAGYRLRMFY